MEDPTVPNVTLTRAIDSSTLVFTSIQEAVDAADSGDSLLIGTGTYREQVLIDSKDLTITAEDGATLESPDNGAIASSGGYNSVLTIKNATVEVANLDIDGRHQGD